MKQLLCTLLLIAPIFSHGSEILTIDLTCDTTDKVTQTLRKEFKEVPILLGQANDEAGSIMSLWMNQNNKSWTIVATKDNISCIVGSGDQLQPVPRGKKDKTFY